MPNNITMLKDLINPEVMADMISATVEAMILATPYARVDNTLVNNEGDTITIPRFTYIGDAIEVGEGEDLPMQKLGTSSAEYTVKMTGNGVTLTDKDVMVYFPKCWIKLTVDTNYIVGFIKIFYQ